MIKLGDALWNKNRHIRLQMIQCDKRSYLKKVSNYDIIKMELFEFKEGSIW